MRCETCDALTANPENEYGEFVCDSCLDNQAERAWERHCNDYEGPLPLIEQQRQALKFK